jgi:hypothetical protein
MASSHRCMLTVSTVVIIILTASLSLSAQTRMNDKDIQHLMNNLVQDAKRFRSTR